jgi:hypothetical protein
MVKSNIRAFIGASAVLCGLVLLSWSVSPSTNNRPMELLESDEQAARNLEAEAVHWSPAQVRVELAKVVQTVLHMLDHQKAGPPGAPGAPGPKGDA